MPIFNPHVDGFDVRHLSSSYPHAHSNTHPQQGYPYSEALVDQRLAQSHDILPSSYSTNLSPHPLPTVHHPVSRLSLSTAPSDIPLSSLHRTRERSAGQIRDFPSVLNGEIRRYTFEEDPLTQAIQQHDSTIDTRSRYTVNGDSFRSLNSLELADSNRSRRRPSVHSAEDQDAEGEVDEDYVPAPPPKRGPEGISRRNVEPVATDADSMSLYERYMKQRYGKEWKSERGSGNIWSPRARNLGR